MLIIIENRSESHVSLSEPELQFSRQEPELQSTGQERDYVQRIELLPEQG